jgi:hypothetical protein
MMDKTSLIRVIRNLQSHVDAEAGDRRGDQKVHPQPPTLSSARPLCLLPPYPLFPLPPIHF